MANKYQFLEHEAWAKSLLYKYIHSFDNKERAHKLSFSDANSKRLYSLAVHICPRLKDVVMWSWISCLDANHRLSSKEILDFAESLDDRHLQACIYYAELLRMKGNQQNKSFAPSFPENNFTPTQNLRLYRGFWSLWQFWTDIRIPKIEDGTTQDHRDNCTKYWSSMWAQGANLRGDGSVEVPAQITTFHPLLALNRLAMLPPARNTSVEAGLTSCGCCFREQARKLSEKLHTQLPYHFLGPPIETLHSSVANDSSNLSQSLDC
jgi:hypothetical protein